MRGGPTFFFPLFAFLLNFPLFPTAECGANPGRGNAARSSLSELLSWNRTDGSLRAPDMISVLEGREPTWLRMVNLLNTVDPDNKESIHILRDYFKENYMPSNLVVISFSMDTIYGDTADFPMINIGVPVHVPIESKEKNFMSNLRTGLGNDPTESLLSSHFPRVRHSRRRQVSLTYEPYQRLMGFAIDVCFIPSIWYIELIHCMYIGVIPRLTGTVFSYTLQDIVGAALMSMGYKDESFILENCFHAVSLIVDDQLSPHYEEICERVSSCLTSGSFGTDFKDQKKELEERISNNYGRLNAKPKSMKPETFYRFSLLLSMSLIKADSVKLKYFPERNFIPVRVAIVSLAYYLVSSRVGLKFSSEKLVAFEITDMITKMLFRTKGLQNNICKNRIRALSLYDKPLTSASIDLFCREVFSIGFIYEDIDVVGRDFERFGNAIVPMRILNPVYPSLIPSMLVESPDSKYDESWLEAVLDIGELPRTPSKPLGTQKVYKSTKLKKTLRKDAYKTGIKASTGKTAIKVRGSILLRSRFTKNTRKLTKGT